MPDEGLPTITSIDQVAHLIGGRRDLYVRWSNGPDADAGGHSRDELTGVELPGLCANPLAVERWWEERPLRLWVARRLYDYHHLREARGPDVRPWILEGDELGRGPDNEPIVSCRRPVAWIDHRVVEEATALVEDEATDWGPLRRR